MNEPPPITYAFLAALRCTTAIGAIPAMFSSERRIGLKVDPAHLRRIMWCLYQDHRNAEIRLKPWLTKIAEQGSIGAVQYEGGGERYLSHHAAAMGYNNWLHCVFKDEYPEESIDRIGPSDFDRIKNLAAEAGFGAFPPNDRMTITSWLTFLRSLNEGLIVEHNRVAATFDLPPIGSQLKLTTHARVSEGLGAHDAETVLRLPAHHFQHTDGRWLTTKLVQSRYAIANQRLTEWRNTPCSALGGRMLWARREESIGWIYHRLDVEEIASHIADRSHD